MKRCRCVTLFGVSLLLMLFFNGCGGNSTSTAKTTASLLHWQNDPARFATGYFLCTEGNEDYYRERYGVEEFECDYLYYTDKQAGVFFKVWDGPLRGYVEDGSHVFAHTADHTLLRIDGKEEAVTVYRAQHGALHLLKLKNGTVYVVDGDRLLKFDDVSQVMTQVTQCRGIVYYYLKENGDVVWENSEQEVYVYSPQTNDHTPVESVAVAIADEMT